MNGFLMLILPVITGLWSFPGCELHTGVEWGYHASVYENHNFYYRSENGQRVSDKGSSFHLFPCAEIYGKVGIGIAGRHELSVLAGMAGVWIGKSAFPVALKYSYFLDGYDKDGYFFFAQRGVDVASFNVRTSKLGFGFRMSLSGKKSLESSLDLKLNTDRGPTVLDFDTDEPVPPEVIFNRRAAYLSAGLSFGIRF